MALNILTPPLFKPAPAGAAITGRDATARLRRLPRRRRGAGAGDARPCRREEDRHAPRSSRLRAPAVAGGRMSCTTVRQVFYAAQIALQPHPQPVLKIPNDCSFRCRLPSPIQKRWEQWVQWEHFLKAVLFQWFAVHFLFPLPSSLFPLFVGTDPLNRGFWGFEGPNRPPVTPNQSSPSSPSNMLGASR